MQARRIAWTTVSLAAVFFGPTVITSDADEIDIGRGPVTVYVPSSYDPTIPAPLLVVLHGFTSSGAFMHGYYGLDPVAEQFGFLHVYPDGTRNASGQLFWNATPACCAGDVNERAVDDSGYLQSLVDGLKARYNIDPRRVYFTGLSNGGAMSHRMACDHADTVAAIASQAGAAFLDPADCQPTAPVHVLQIHGTSDATVGYDGGSSAFAPYPGALDTVEQWAAHNGCAPEFEGFTPGCGQGGSSRGGGGSDTAPPCDTSLGTLDLVGSLAGEETVITRFTADCELGGSAELWTMQNAPHVPDLSPDFGRLLVGWLLAHPKVDCNGNGVPDDRDIADGASTDCDSNGFPDECDPDCNGNGVPDDCDIADGTSTDCDANGFPDECDPDCNGNGVADSCEIADGTARNLNDNDVLDECELHLFGDLDLDGDIDVADYISFTECVGGAGERPPSACCRGTRRGPCDSPADLDGDGDVDLTDVVIFQASFTGSR